MIVLHLIYQLTYNIVHKVLNIHLSNLKRCLCRWIHAIIYMNVYI